MSGLTEPIAQARSDSDAAVVTAAAAAAASSSEAAAAAASEAAAAAASEAAAATQEEGRIAEEEPCPAAAFGRQDVSDVWERTKRSCLSSYLFVCFSKKNLSVFKHVQQRAGFK